MKTLDLLIATKGNTLTTPEMSSDIRDRVQGSGLGPALPLGLSPGKVTWLVLALRGFHLVDRIGKIYNQI